MLLCIKWKVICFAFKSYCFSLVPRLSLLRRGFSPLWAEPRNKTSIAFQLSEHPLVLACSVK